MATIKQDEMQFVFLKGNAFLLKGRIIIVLDYQSRKPASLLEPPKTFITAEFKLVYSHSGCLKMLRRLAFEYRKPKALPRVAGEDKQAEFIAFYQDLITKLPAD